MAKKLSDKLAGTKLGSMFFETDEEIEGRKEEPQNATGQEKSTTKVFQNPVATPSFVSSSFTPQVFSSVDPEVRAKIQAIADGSDQVSFTKFQDLVRNMSVGAPDEASRYRLAFAAGKAFSLPALEVLRGVDAILNDLSQAERKFKDAVPQRISSRVGARRDKIAQIKQAISLKQDEVKRLQEAVGRLNMEISQLSQTEQIEQTAISQDEQSVREDLDKFNAALEAVREPYLAERQKIELYGKGV